MSEHGTVILLHGFGMRPITMLPVGRSLHRAGFATLALPYRSRLHPLEQIVDELLPMLNGVKDGPVHFVTHSMGGLVARALIARARPKAMDKVVMLGPPHGGSEWVDLLARARISGTFFGPAEEVLSLRRPERVESLLGEVDYPIGIIAGNRPTGVPIFSARIMPGPHDGKVSVAATHLRGEADHIVMPVSHMAMIWDGAVQAQVVHFLRHGSFAQETEAKP
ncbi:esterase/lipase family protein [Novosphingopyxis sp.]|uniref:esterase/lipase family protein n=1 Tax=Novosphingopyxis sp. TaxID=2709690 RepID=UPI003B59A40A